MGIQKKLRVIFHRLRWERDLEDELATHVALRADEIERSGVPRAEAERQARIELGSRPRYRDEVREAFGLRVIDELQQDLRFAWRVLRRSPGFTIVAVISMALGVGANTAVFGVLNTILFKPLPHVAHQDEVQFVQNNRFPSLSYPNYRDFRDRTTMFSGWITYRPVAAGLSTGSSSDARVERMWGYLASGNYFDVLGVQPALGRLLRPEDDQRRDANPYLVLSYECWQSRFQADPRIAGRTVRINSLPYTVVGVAPRSFRGTEIFFLPEFWVPMSMQGQIEQAFQLENRNTFNYWVVARMKPGVTKAQAQADLTRVADDLKREYPNSNEGLKYRLTKPGLLGDELRGPTEPFAAAVMILAGLVLLAACVNLASMLGARSADRFREIAVRVSIGASRARIVRQILTETILLTTAAGAIGCIGAFAALRWLSGWQPPTGFGNQFDLDPDGRVLFFAAAASILAGALAAIAPARQALRMNPNGAMKGATGDGTRARKWAARDLLMAGQVALCSVLVACSFVAARGLAKALSAPLGMQLKGASAVALDLGLAHYSREQGRSFQRRALEAISQLPGVTSAAYSNTLPLALNQSNNNAYREGQTDLRQVSGILARNYQVSPGYFATVGTRLRAGRDFTWHDDASAPYVAVVNETFARLFFGSTDAVGRHFRFGGSDRLAEVVGVAEDGKYSSFTEAPRPVVFRPSAQVYNSETVLLARSTVDESALANQMRQAIASLDPTLPAYSTGSLTQVLAIAFAPSYAATLALGAFGILAAMLAVTGIYGLTSYAVSRRVREIGIRIAIGATPAQVLATVLGRTAILVGAGAAAGLALGAGASRLLANVVYQASARDPLTLTAAGLAMGVVALAAALGPARRMLRLDPLTALREG